MRKRNAPAGIVIMDINPMRQVHLPEKRAFLHRSSRPEQFNGAVIALVWIVSAALVCAMLILLAAQCSRILFS